MRKNRFIVIGAGLVGLSTAYELIRQFPDAHITLVEKELKVGMHQSGHNSGVIHSGIYYKPGSLKAINCIRGRRELIEFCEEQEISYEICGKLIVANSPEEVASLEKIYERGIAHGLKVSLIDAEAARSIEPYVSCQKALRVPEAGIVSYPNVAEKLETLIRAKGGEIKLGFRVTKISFDNKSIKISSPLETIEGSYFVNCAGLYSDRIARLMGVFLPIKIIPFRGEYYRLNEDSLHLCKNLIYPVPDLRFPFLGVHFTRMIDGGVECGPNAVFALSREGYAWRNISIIDTFESLTFRGFQNFIKEHWYTGFKEIKRSLSKAQFAQSLAQLIPTINEGTLIEGGSGVRAQALDVTGKLIDDFLFHSSARGLHVLNSPSPAATSCLALGSEIVRKLTNEIGLATAR